VHSWRSLYDRELGAEPASRVTWEIEPGDGGVCSLTVIHEHGEHRARENAPGFRSASVQR
jgi:hypothetical protein